MFARKLIKNLSQKYILFNRTKAFKKRYSHIEKILFKKTIDYSVIRHYKEKWSAYNEKVELDTFLLCYNLSDKHDLDIIPENLFAAIIEPKLNPYKELSIFDVKNIYELWFSGSSIFPKSYFHKIDGIFYDAGFTIITEFIEWINSAIIEFPVIIKPSMETYGGAGVTVVQDKDELLRLAEKYKHVVCQEMIRQNDYLCRINPGLNSIRTCLYRTQKGLFKVINNSIRFGVNGGLDNETAGGIVCSIKPNGTLNEYAVNKYAVKYLSHPNSHVVFSDVVIPFYKDLEIAAEKIANKIPLCNLLSLDMCLDQKNEWRCLEVNTVGHTIRFAQYAGNGFFGKFTDEVIERTT